MATNLRPIAFQVAASMVLWECYASLGKPTEALVNHVDVMRVVAPSDLDLDSDEARDLAVVCAESVDAAHGWLKREGFIRSEGYGGLGKSEWELTMAGVSALNLKLSLDSQVPDQTAGQYLGDLVERVKSEADARAPGLLVDAAAVFFGRVLPMLAGAG